MKKIVIVCIVGVVLSFAGLALNAKNDTSKSSELSNYVDINDDGICDNKNLNTDAQNNNYVDTNNDGVCDNKSTNMQRNNNFVDSNNDSICDNINNKHHHRYRNK